jgi:hypothetical protein
MAALAFALAFTPACREPDRRPDGPPPAVEPAAADGTADATAVAAAERVRLRLEANDFWLDRFGRYMDDATVDRYLATPRERRFEKFGPFLLECERRDALLDEHVRLFLPLAAEDEARYLRLPDLEASRAFLARLAAAAGRWPGTDGGQPDGR